MEEHSDCTSGVCPGTSAKGEVVSICTYYNHPLLQFKRALAHLGFQHDGGLEQREGVALEIHAALDTVHQDLVDPPQLLEVNQVGSLPRRHVGPVGQVPALQ